MASAGFVGRAAELARLDALFGRVGDARRDLPGVAVLLRGRRRVGKSRLVEVFCERAGLPFVFFQASQGADPAAERAAFAAAVLESDIPGRELFEGGTVLPTWAALFRQLAAALPADAPSIVVIDELPWLIETDPALEGALQTAWDSLLSRKPVLLVLIGSDLAMMERLDDYRRPFHQRGTVMVLPPLNPAEVGTMIGLPTAEAIDAYLITGGLPLICQEWGSGQSVESFLAVSLADPTSALLVSGERSLAAEFPGYVQARSVLAAIGHGERTWSGIRAASASAEPMAASSLTNALRLLEAKRVVAVDTPLSTKPAEKERRYRVADPYLRFYLAYLAAGLPLVERGRGDLLLRRVHRSWTTWRGRAVEPVVREALLRIAPELGWPEVEAVGGWWNRQNNPEIDLVGADRTGAANRIIFAGSIKWQTAKPFDQRDHAALIRDVAAVPGVDPGTKLLAVSRTGVAADLPLRSVGPDEIMTAWR
ncbi:ATP-binding protein [Frankia sp. CiP3]|uniref:ATP-binding protein n=1 Tax=Frankia sp. CiP3 TaxID=2880971 RepID=UPI001EF4C16C|nr:ATP-binding protein [Frankia sp. CiP3]